MAANGRGGSGGAGEALAMRQGFQAVLEAVHSGNISDFKKHAKRFSKKELLELRDTYGRTVLHHASQQGHLPIVRHIIEDVGIDVNVQDNTGEGPIAMAGATGRVDTVKYLLSKGADVNLRKEPEGTSALHRAATFRDTEIMKLLVEAGARVNVFSKTGTPLCWAAGAGLPDNVEFLIKQGAEASPSASSEAGALLLAAASGCERSVELLLAAGADVRHVGPGGSTALHAAAAVDLEVVKSVGIVQRLLEAGAQPNVCDEGGMTALTIASARGSLPLVKVLLQVTEPGSGMLEGIAWDEDSVVKAAGERIKALKDRTAAGKPSEIPNISGKEVVAIPEPPEPDEAKALNFKRSGDQAFVKGDYAAAIEGYSQSLRHGTRNAVIWANRSMAYLRIDKPLEALSDAKLSRALDPTYVKAWYREGCAYAALKRWEDAACAFFEGSNLEPGNKDVAKAFQDAIAEGRKEAQAKH